MPQFADSVGDAALPQASARAQMVVRGLAAPVCDQFRSVLSDRRRQRALRLEDARFMRHFTHPRGPGCARFVMLFTDAANLLPSNIREGGLVPLPLSRNVGRMSPATAR
nr:hypothetical protein GCM10020063_074180 [Dactylosporangium thailandense]